MDIPGGQVGPGTRAEVLMLDVRRAIGHQRQRRLFSAADLNTGLFVCADDLIVGTQCNGRQATLRPHQRLQTLLLSSPTCRFVAENLQRLIELLNLQWLLQDRDRTNLKDPIQDFAIRVTCDHDNVEAWINLLGYFIYLITGRVGQL